MAPKSQNPKAPARGATARDGSPSVRPQTSLQEESPEAELPERETSPDYGNAIDAIAQLQEEMQSLQASRQQDHDLLAQILAQVTKNSTQPGTLHTQAQSTSRTIERDTPGSPLSSPDTNPRHYSKKLPDPPPLSDGIDPTFASWKIQIQGKFRVNADHFLDEEAKMLYLFNRTTGDAQKHLQPRYDFDAQTRFVSAMEMVQLLASVFVNPNLVRDARYDYSRLVMAAGQPFTEFQTQFLHLAGQAQTPAEDLRLDLYDKLTTQLQRGIAPNLRSLDTYAELAASCQSLDTELKRITARESQQRRQRSVATAPLISTAPTALRLPSTMPTGPRLDSVAPRASKAPDNLRVNQSRQATPLDSTITCYNCHKPGHIAPSCPEPRKGDLKEIEEELYDDQENNDNESGNEEP